MNKGSGRAPLYASIAAACVLLAACGKQASPTELMARGEDYLAKRDYHAATIELKSAVVADTGNPRARWLLGKVYMESGDLESAAKELTKARELGMPDTEVLPLLVQALLPLGMHDELMALPATGLDAPTRARVLAAQGQSLLANGKLEEGGKRLEQALDADPKASYVRLAHARLLLFNSQMEAGRRDLEALLADEPDYALAWTLLGDLEQSERHPERAEEAYTKALEFAPNSYTDRLNRALARIQLQKADAAAEDIEVLRRKYAKRADERTEVPLGVNYAEGLLHMQKNELEAARTAFELTLRGGNQYPLALFYLAGIQAQLGNPEQADTYITEFGRLAPDHPSGHKLAASIAMQRGDFVRAERLVRPVVAANPEDLAALNLLAGALLAQNRTDEGLDTLTKIAALDPDSAEAQTRLAAGLFASGQGEVGLEHLRKALELDPKYQQADLMLVLAHARKGEFDEALAAARAFQQRQPESATPLSLLGRIYLATDRQAEAKQAFLDALKLDSGDPAANQSLAALALQDRDLAGARRYYEQVLAKHPDNLRVQMQLAALDFNEGHAEAMVKRLQDSMAAHPDNPEPRLMLARHYLNRGEGQQALAVLNALDETQKKQPAVTALLAMLYLSQSDFAAARPLLERMVQLQPEVAQNHYQLAMAQAALGDTRAMLSGLQKTIALEPKHVPARVALAHGLLATQDREGFELQLKALQTLEPDSAEVLSLEASAALLQGNRKEALAKLEQAYTKEPSPTTLQNLAREKLRGGDMPGALKLFEKWIGEHPQDLQMQMALADLYAADRQDARAIAQYEAVVKADERHVIALNNLAWSLRKSKPKQALAYAERANRIAPDTAALIDTFAMVLLENGDNQKAQTQIERALKLEPNNPGMRFHAAQIRLALDDTDGAVLILKSLLGGKGDFAEKAEAEALLASLKKD